MKKIFKYFYYLILFPLLFISLYFLTAYLFTFFPKENLNQHEKKTMTYLLYSEIHTDIVLNIKDFNISQLPEFQEKKMGYLAFGWGDKETYLTTPKIDNIKLSTTLKALFINTPSLMHVRYIPKLSVYKNIKSIKISKKQKEHLKNLINKSFDFQKKTHKGYGREDFFYTAKGQYNLINTCNTWTGDKLRESNVSIAYWTPFVWSITNALP